MVYERRNDGIMRLFAFLFAAAALLSLFSCGKGKPEILPEKKMEEVLYDYHLAEGIARFGGVDSATEAHYLALALEKHGVTQALFDSSMVFYMRHADRLYDIYSRLSDRLTNEGRLQGVASDNLITAFSLEGDTADIWQLGDKHVFTSFVPDNMLRFRIAADSTFRPGDRFVFSFKTEFLYQEGTRNGFAAVSFRLANDSVVTRTKQLSAGNTNAFELVDDRRIGMKEISGYILQKTQPAPQEQGFPPLKLMLLSDIHFIKMHTEEPEDFAKEEETETPDSLSAEKDSINNETKTAVSETKTTDSETKTTEQDLKNNETIKPLPPSVDSKVTVRSGMH